MTKNWFLKVHHVVSVVSVAFIGCKGKKIFHLGESSLEFDFWNECLRQSKIFVKLFFFSWASAKQCFQFILPIFFLAVVDDEFKIILHVKIFCCRSPEAVADYLITLDDDQTK
ncbi:uncharacterized protein BX664DRAFT_310303 [Halteromyces radiatus]|uniref:uncharacterized protein n=1 Tax=Halteromyces radiatus TaxID=101107 RepID=UPI002220608C|nr:uncharacterized protein BX664DRAFT_310303 [Halteromyces radiatus]KAI8099316.1 hypothetical protein BX664DRAFT_310303 [Halteromyces radiatus]